MRRQLSGPENRSYMLRFEVTARALERSLRLLGCEVERDGTGMAYVVTRGDRIIGGPASCQEQAMYSAAAHLEEAADA